MENWKIKRSIIYKICGLVGITSSVAVVASDLIGIAVHEKHNPIDDTISMLAIGKYGWIQDTGLDIFALGFFVLAVGLFVWRRKGWKWITSLIILILLSIDLVLIAEHNQYAGRPGYSIHRELVYVLAGLFLILNILIGLEKKPLSLFLTRFSRGIALLWLFLAPLFPVIPDEVEGAYERLVASLLVVWLTVFSYFLYKASRSDAIDSEGSES